MIIYHKGCQIKRTERGWPGHYIAAFYCTFRMNTLLEYNGYQIVISTVGNKRIEKNGIVSIEPIRIDNGFYETMVFHAYYNGKYIEANVGQDIDVASNWVLRYPSVDDMPDNVDNLVVDMHETIVNEICQMMIDNDPVLQIKEEEYE